VTLKRPAGLKEKRLQQLGKLTGRRATFPLSGEKRALSFIITVKSLDLILLTGSKRL